MTTKKSYILILAVKYSQRIINNLLAIKMFIVLKRRLFLISRQVLIKVLSQMENVGK